MSEEGHCGEEGGRVSYVVYLPLALPLFLYDSRETFFEETSTATLQNLSPRPVRRALKLGCELTTFAARYVSAPSLGEKRRFLAAKHVRGAYTT